MRVLLFVLAILFMFQAQAGNKNEKKMRSYSVSGKVVGGEDGLTGVKVMLDNKETVVYTDFDGNFTINNLRGDNHTISFSLIAYDTKEVVVNSNESNSLLIKLYGK